MTLKGLGGQGGNGTSLCYMTGSHLTPSLSGFPLFEQKRTNYRSICSNKRVYIRPESSP